jgi:hypothetical protein
VKNHVEIGKLSADQEIAKKSNNFKSIFKVIESSNKFSSIVHQIQCSAIKKIGENSRKSMEN